MIYNTLYLFYPSGLFFNPTSIFLFCLNKVYYFFSLRCERQSLPLVSNLLSLKEHGHLNFIRSNCVCNNSRVNIFFFFPFFTKRKRTKQIIEKKSLETQLWRHRVIMFQSLLEVRTSFACCGLFSNSLSPSFTDGPFDWMA